MSEHDDRPRTGRRIGVYVCHCGGNIADVVDVEAVALAASQLDEVVVARTHAFMCSEAGQGAIAQDIEEQGLDGIVVASCSPALHESTFRRALARGGLNPFLYEHANIREQVSWVSTCKATATGKAATLVRAAVAKARLLRPLAAVRVTARQRVLVVGAGVAGLRAALDLAGLGLEVLLIDAAEAPGGHLRRLDRLYPDGESAPRLLAQLEAQVAAASNITLRTRTEVVASGGSVGAFEVTLRGPQAEGEEPSERVESVGAVVLATGFRPYLPRKGEFGSQKNEAVLTLPEFGALLAASPAGEPLVHQGRVVRSLGFLHCVGSRQVDGVHKPGPGGRLQTHCSRVCCTALLHTELQVAERWPDLRIHSMYQDIRAYGRGHEDLYLRASRAGVVFHRYPEAAPPTVAKAPAASGAALRLTLSDGLSWREEIELDLDLLVLGTGMTAGDTESLADVFKLACSEDGFLQEVHPKLRPVEPAVAGIFLAGACQSPKDVGEACASASAAAVKVGALLGRGEVELPPFVAQVDPARCDGTGTCVTACGYEGAIRLQETEHGLRAAVNPALCVGCGACVAVCPNRALDVAGWSLDQFDAMVDAIVAAEVRP